MATTSVDERFEAKFVLGAPNECWEWQAGRIKDGYGRFAAPKDHLAVVFHHVGYTELHWRRLMGRGAEMSYSSMTHRVGG